MTMTVHCPNCPATIDADDEADLVSKVQAHIRDDHKATHEIPAKHILAMLRRQQSGDSSGQQPQG